MSRPNYGRKGGTRVLGLTLVLVGIIIAWGTCDWEGGHLYEEKGEKEAV